MSLADPQTTRHLATLLRSLQQPNYNNQQLHLLSGTIKKQNIDKLKNNQKTVLIDKPQRQWKHTNKQPKNYMIQNFVKESKKLAQAGFSFGSQFTHKIQMIMNELAQKQNVQEIRFWGLIHGTKYNYYVIQGKKQTVKTHEETPKGSEKQGQGVNFYTYWVANNPLSYQWQKLPNITLQQVVASRKIKKLFTGILTSDIKSEPKYPGLEKHYLKAQICRITHSLQIVPKGIYKLNDDNPKIVQFEDEVKLPEFAQVSTNQGWFHRNQMILGLGRCSHYIDQSLSEEQIEAKANYLTQNDPEIERLRGITQDKVPENLNLGLENPWILRISSNNQVFTKDQNSLVYGIVTLKNIFWPGWTTVGYRQGFSNIYIGNGHKNTQPTKDNYTNPDLCEQKQEQQQYPQPYPLELPPEKPQGQENQGGQQNIE